MKLEIVNTKDEVIVAFQSELERFTLNEKYCLMQGNYVFFGLDCDNKPLYVRKLYVRNPKVKCDSAKITISIDGKGMPL